MMEHRRFGTSVSRPVFLVLASLLSIFVLLILVFEPFSAGKGNTQLAKAQRAAMDTWALVQKVNPSACPNPVGLGGNPHLRTDSAGRMDGMWKICVDEKLRKKSKSSCRAMSFGINDDPSFENALIENLNCKVYAYDPTIDYVESKYNKTKLVFNKIGIAGDDKRPNYKTLRTLMDENQISVLDILKVDVEYAEWDMLESVMPKHVLRDRVKQFAVEFHFWPQYRCQGGMDNLDCVEEKMLYYFRWMKALEDEGFVAYDSHLNPGSSGWRVGPWYQFQNYRCCFEVSFVNKRFFGGSAELDGDAGEQ